MKVAYVFSTSGHTSSYKLGQMILPQLEQDGHGDVRQLRGGAGPGGRRDVA